MRRETEQDELEDFIIDRKSARKGASSWEDGPEPLKPWAIALIFLGIAVLAALICGVLWHFTHREKPEGTGDDSSIWQEVDATQKPDGDSDAAGEEGKADGTSEGTSGGDEGTEPGTGQNPGGDRDTEPGTGTGQTPGGNAGTEPGTGQTPGGDGDTEPGTGTGQTPGGNAGTESGTGQAPGGDGAAEPGGGPETENGQNPGAESSGDGNGGSANQQGEAPGTGQGQEAPGSGTASGSGSQNAGPSQDAMTFTDRQDSVTPKEVVNLRSVPTTLDPANIITQVKNGEVLARTGINEETGWSRLAYAGNTVYAVTSNLSTDLNYTPPTAAPDRNTFTTAEGRVIVFKDCDDWVTPKEYTNLRTEPSTAQGNATVKCQLNYGERAHRTGYSEDTGWSRVEFNGEVLYVVSSLVFSVEEAAE